MWKCGLIAALGVMATQAVADDDRQIFELGPDVYLSGQSITMDQAQKDDAFLAGETVSLTQPIAGTAHMVGRWVKISAPVGDSVYAAGQTVTIEEQVTKNVTVAGQEVTTRGGIGGDLRVFASEVKIEAPVGETLIVAGEFVEIDAPVAGDMALSAREIDFGDSATVGGTLFLYEDELGAMEIPESVAPASRIERREVEAWERDFGEYNPLRPRSLFASFVKGVIILAALAAAIAALAPQTLASWREQFLGAPGRSFLAGFVALSALIGSGVILAMTLIGMLLTPAAILLAVAAGFLGYVVGAYAVGVWALSLAKQGIPDTLGKRAIAAAIGAVLVGIVGLVPFFGWLVLLALALTGLGAVALKWLRPRFFVPAEAAQ